MNNKGFAGEIIFGVIMVTLLGNVVVKSLNLNFKSEEGEVTKKGISFTELSKNNGQTIWCKMKGRTDCD